MILQICQAFLALFMLIWWLFFGNLGSWAFINHIALVLNYKIYNLSREKKLLSNFSVADFLAHLKYIFKVKSGNNWQTSEMTKKTTDSEPIQQ
jgi:L-rhamnose mutarotase